MNGSNDSQKLDLIITEQKKLRSLVDKVEVSILDKITELTKEVRTSNKVLKNHEERIVSLESHHPSATLT